ncbi:hypothetical protein CLPU_5c00750 [Gottschalkia purinilytica]|uniref:Metal-binding protein n=1 Tax=Gottschalkia purinilytica TaxID=1503 RepID=A0A0L0WB87_GOTPU|nr:DUF177 domain-containing protein [Gottschalkia purinilytica]KNF08768.1 hypothetical protein CLPU_5c00750 [Gottschalkia purinilytica]
MKLDLSMLLDRTVHKIDINKAVDVDLSSNGMAKQRDLKLLRPAEIEGSIYNTDEGLFLDAKVTYNYSENCARCLAEFENTIEVVLSGKIVEKNDENREQESDEIIIYYNGDEVEIEEAIASTILLSLPMKSLCKEDCKGLCDMCGKDLNSEQCKCTKEEIDPRLAKLKDLFD